MKALTVRHPFAWAIASGGKDVENRARQVKHRGTIAIHAGAAWYPGAEHDQQICDAWYRAHGTKPDAAELDLRFTFRHLIAVADLHDCHVPEPGCCSSPWARPDAGAHLLLRNVQRLTWPLLARGALGLWPLPRELEQQVARDLEVPF